VLVLLGVSSSLVLLEFELTEISDATHRRLGSRGDLDQVQAGFFRTADGLFNWQNANLLTVRVKNTDFGGSNLAIGTRTSGGRRARDEWWTRNRRFSLLTTRQILGILENVKLLRPFGTPVSRRNHCCAFGTRLQNTQRFHNSQGMGYSALTSPNSAARHFRRPRQDRTPS
jgi:hypothetical protein